MTNLERAQKIIEASRLLGVGNGKMTEQSFGVFVIAQLDEAVREGLTPELVQTILDKGRNEALNDYKIKECHFKEGFAIAREQAAGIVEGWGGFMADLPSEIRKMQ